MHKNYFCFLLTQFFEFSHVFLETAPATHLTRLVVYCRLKLTPLWLGWRHKAKLVFIHTNSMRARVYVCVCTCILMCMRMAYWRVLCDRFDHMAQWLCAHRLALLARNFTPAEPPPPVHHYNQPYITTPPAPIWIYVAPSKPPSVSLKPLSNTHYYHYISYLSQPIRFVDRAHCCCFHMCRVSHWSFGQWRRFICLYCLTLSERVRCLFACSFVLCWFL